MKSKENWVFEGCPELDTPVNWEVLSQMFDWFEQLQATPQNPVYHREGDVFTHTKMVVNELVRLDLYKALPPEMRSVLFLGTLMHDIGKPLCTKTENGRIISPGHARIGARLSRAMFYREEIKVPFKEREMIVRLVHDHGVPLWVWDRKDPERIIIQTSCKSQLSLLYLLATADVLGRICQDQELLFDRLNYFRELAGELDCYETPYRFKSDLMRFNYFQKPHADRFYQPYDESICTVTLLSGLPGSGKDTFIQENLKDQPVISLDAIRRKYGISPKDKQGFVIQQAKEAARVFLRKKQDFVWNATNITKSLRSRLIDLFLSYKAKVNIIYIEVPYTELLERNSVREHPVPLPVLEKMIDKLEIPEIGEAHEVILHTEYDENF